METAQAKELLSLLSERTGTWQALWTTYYTVSGALVTLIASGKFLPGRWWAASAIAAAAFLLFAAGNFRALDELRKQRDALVHFVKDKARDDPHITVVAEASAPPDLEKLRMYYWGLSVLVVVLMFAIPAFQKTP